MVKGAVVESFYTSEEGINKELGYQGMAFLVNFDGCTHASHATPADYQPLIGKERAQAPVAKCDSVDTARSTEAVVEHKERQDHSAVVQGGIPDAGETPSGLRYDLWYGGPHRKDQAHAFAIAAQVHPPPNGCGPFVQAAYAE